MSFYFLIFFPLVGSLICLVFNQKSNFDFLLNYIFLIVVGFIFLFSGYFLLNNNLIYCLEKNMEIFKFKYFLIFPWIKIFDINLIFAIDNLSALMMFITSFLFFVFILNSWNYKIYNKGFYYFLLIICILCVICLFLSFDLFLFFIFWEIMSVPAYFLIINFGDSKKLSERSQIRKIANEFFIYMQCSGLILIISIIYLVMTNYYSTNILTFNYFKLMKSNLPFFSKFFVFLGFFISFSIKMPFFPFHRWMVNIYKYSSIDGFIDLILIIIKISGYAFIRFIINFLHEDVGQFFYIGVIFGLINIFYGSFLAFNQKNIKSFIAYNNLFHIGFISISIFLNSVYLYKVSIFQIISNSISNAALIIVVNQIYKRLKTRNIFLLTGFKSTCPLLSSFFLFSLISSIGFPGTSNFIGELIVLLVSFLNSWYFLLILFFGILLMLIGLFRVIHNVFFGKSNCDIIFFYLEKNEIISLIILAFFIILFGFFPQSLLKLISIKI